MDEKDKQAEKDEQDSPEQVQTETGHLVPEEDLPDDEMTKVERERAGKEPVEGDDEEDGSDDDKED